LNACIHDKQGRDYLVVTDDVSERFKRFFIEYNGTRIGHAYWHFEGNEVLFLDDIHIKDKAIRPPIFLLNLHFCMVSFPPKKRRITNYRARGIGTSMIIFLVNYARSKSVKRIEGKISVQDYKENPDLPEWYRRRGFTVVLSESPQVANISLTID